MKTLTFSPDFVAEQIDQWERHRQLVRQVPHTLACRHLAGLAMVLLREHPVETGDGRAFAFDRDVAWLSLVDVPLGHWRLRRPRPVNWVNLLRTRLINCLPALGPTPLRQWDFAVRPVTAGMRSGKHAFDPAMSPRYFGILNALELAMTSACSWLNGSWRRACVKRFAAELQLDKGIRLGDATVDNLPRPWQWMPRPYLAFPLELADCVWDMVQIDGEPLEAVHDGFRRQTQSSVPTGLKIRLNGQGRIMADGAPPVFGSVPSKENLKHWFESRVYVSLAPEKGLVHLPAELVTPIAEKHAVESELAWCLEPAARYMCQRLGAFIHPPICLKTWDDWQGILPGEVAVDFAPRHREFVPRREIPRIVPHAAA